MRLFVLIFAAAMALLFGTLFALTWASPITVEHWAREAIEHQVEQRVGGELHELSQASLVRKAMRVIDFHRRESAFDSMVLAKLHAEVVRISANMLDPDCTCRQRMLAFLKEGVASHMQWLGGLDARLTTMIESKYAQVAQALVREVRIFSAANALVFALLWLVALLRPDAKRQLVGPVVVLVGSTGLVGYFYLFQQDWLQTVLFGHYVGLWYFGYLAIAAAFLADIVFNKGRVTGWLLGAAGGAVPVVPC